MDAKDGKFVAAGKAIKFVHRGQTIGLGTGSTAEVFIRLLAEKNKKTNLNLTCVATSIRSEKLAKKLGLRVKNLNEVESIDTAFDGADIVVGNNLIKGMGGGAIAREKCVDYRAKKFVVIAGKSKIRKVFGGILPIEVIPMAASHVSGELQSLGARSAAARKDGAKNFITDNGNMILHADFPKIASPKLLEQK
ncbi:MAG: ribose 5-phosphate isomerase A, partial [Candidatus Micrarchaeota archaeon]|nr:ribose 5-phosphate isomerase A [Candidatus Micrarchaeota archaeon]